MVKKLFLYSSVIVLEMVFPMFIFTAVAVWLMWYFVTTDE